jgi:glycosyltransferase involved in cell wall biosynthesis
MISKEISEKVLTVGCAYNPPKGGVAQVIYTYSQEVYPVFRCVVNSGKGGAVVKLWYAMRGLMKMALALVFDKNIRIVHIHTASYNSFKRSVWFIRLAKVMFRKVVLHIHGGGFREYYNTNPRWILKMLKKADCILALTDSWRKFYSEELQLPNVVTVPNIVSNPQIKKVEHDGRLHLLFLGAINEQKGIFDLLKVINEHKIEWAEKFVLHVGGNQEIERLQEYVKANELSELVHYEGWVNGEKKIELLNLMDAFILPSYVEGLPIAILEALSYGKPVITTPVGGIPEIVNDKNGFLFSPGDVGAMGTIINTIVCDSSILHEKSSIAEASVKLNYPESVSSILENKYESLIK